MQGLFTYGTLSPEDPQSAAREGWLTDAVRGRLFNLGPYPALIDLDDPAAAWVEGSIPGVTTEQLEGILDDYEGVAEGLFRRVETTTRTGRHVWVYVYARSLPAAAIGPTPRRHSSKRERLLGPPECSPGGHP
jgi:gamma-glutamylcyclotransferase (GGCT)/AIG2-like uncharacterized protein YtfP